MFFKILVMKVGLLGPIRAASSHSGGRRKSHLKRRSSGASVSVEGQKQTFYELPGFNLNVVALKKHQRLVSLYIQARISLFRDCFLIYRSVKILDF